MQHYTEQNIRDVWDLYKAGKLRKVIARELKLTPQQVDYCWKIANQRWGKVKKTHMPKFITRIREEPKKPFKRPPAIYSNKQWENE